MNLYPALSVLAHLLRSRSTAGHGVHSPFVYDFLTQAVRNKQSADIVKHIRALKDEMVNDRRIISVIDLGAGSLKGAGSERKVSRILADAALPVRQAWLLGRMCRWYNERQADYTGGDGIILELGTSLGVSALALSLAAPGRRVVTVEGCPVLSAIAAENLQRHGADNVQVINMEFSEALAALRQKGEKIVFAYIDGNHRGDALAKYVTGISQAGEEMVIVTDDIHLSRDMHRGWDRIRESGIAQACIETTRFGVLFIRRNFTPGHYRIRC